MNNLLKSSLAASALTLFIAAPASATDLGTKGDPTSADYVAPISWSGFYVGGRIGYGNANHDLTINQYNSAYCYDTFGNQAPISEDFDPSSSENQELNIFGDFRVLNLPVEGGCEDILTGGNGGQYTSVDASNRDVANLDGLNSHGIVGGAQIGYDQQMGRFVIGVFGSYDLSGMETTGTIASISNTDVAYDVSSIEKGDEWSVGARAGLLVNQRTLVYLLAAYSQTEYDFKGVDGVGDAFSKATTFDGVSVGGGIEFALTQNVFLGLEYAHTFYGEETVLDTGGSEHGGLGRKIVDDLDEDKVMATLKVKLNSGLGF